MRKIILNLVFGVFIGAFCGHGFFDWQYWIIFACIGGLVINNSED